MQPTTEDDGVMNYFEVLAVGRMVHVASRTWPGINEPGGVGRIIAVHAITSNDAEQMISHVDVHYMVLRRREKRIPVQYVKLAPEYETSEESHGRLRDRNRLKGRCGRCGSLRIDCGSCDWLDEMGQQIDRNDPKNEEFQEEDESSSDDEQLQSKLQHTYQNFRSLRKRWGRRRLQEVDKDDIMNADEAQDDDELSLPKQLQIDEDDDDEEFLDALASSNSRYSLLKARWRRFGNRGENASKAPESPSSDDNIALADLAWQPQSTVYQERAVRARSKGSHRFSGPSVLESIGINRKEKNESQFASGEKYIDGSRLTGKDRKSQHLEDEEESENEEEQRLSLDHIENPNQGQETPDRAQLEKNVGFVNDVGEAESDFEDDSMNDNSSSPFVNEDPDFQPRSPNTFTEPFAIKHDVSDELLPLGDFIQPEGEEAVQNLPTDTIDLSRNIGFKSLPLFFDQMATKIEDEILPDAKLDLAYFEREIAEAGYSADEAEVKCLEMYNSLRDRLVRDGTDQCRLTLRRLDNAKLYRLHCKGMSPHERKQFRGITMEMRDIRLEDLDEVVGRLMKKALHLSLAHRNDRMYDSDVGDEVNSPGSLPTVNEYDTQDLLQSEISEVASSSVTAQDLFDPHHNAKRVRQSQVDSFPFRKKERHAKRLRRIGGAASKESAQSTARFGKHRVDNCTDSDEHSAGGERQPKKKMTANLEVLQDVQSSIQGKIYEITERSKKRTSKNTGKNFKKAAGVQRPKRKDNHFLDSMAQVRIDGSVNDLHEIPRHGPRNIAETRTPRIETRPSIRFPESAVDELASQGFPDLCLALLDKYADSPGQSTQIIDEIQCRLNSHVVPDSTVFSSILQLLHTHGNATLQELVSIKNPTLPLHVKLLVLTLSFLEKGLDLNPDDGVVYQVFGENRGRRLVEMLLLQLVDAMYAAVHPQAWGRVERDKDALISIAPLRDAIARLLPIAESVSHCVMYKLGLQRWQRRGDAYAWVSCVDPAWWEELLVSGNSPEAQQEIRFANFHGKLPRCEIDALWEIIAYCSEAESKTESKSHSRWELLSFLLSRGAGVLSESDMLRKNDVPSNDQLALCAKELNQLSELLRRGFLDDLPSSDTFLIKTIEKSLALQADASVPLEGDRSRCDLKMLSQEVHKFWEATNLCKKYDVHVAPTTVSTLVEYIGPSDNSIACLLPYNLIATNCLRLLGFWMDHVPAKRARWLRLLRAIESLVSKAQSISQMGSGGDVFPTATLTNPRNNCKLLVYGEAATYISILSAVFCALRAASKDDEIYQSKSFSELVCRTVWSNVADDNLQRKQEWVMAGAKHPTAGGKYGGHAMDILVASKAMALLAFLHLGIPFWKLSSERVVSQLSPELFACVTLDNNCLQFLFSCLQASMDGLCDLLAQQSILFFNEDNDSASIADVVVNMSRLSWQMGVFLVHIGNIASPASSNLLKNAQLDASIKTFVKSFFPVTSQILTRSLLSLAHIATGGKEVDACFRSCLGVLRSCLRVLNGAQNFANEQTIGQVAPSAALFGEDDGDDFFAGIDDNALACLDLQTQTDIEPMPPGNSPHLLCSQTFALRNVGDSLTKLVCASKPSNRFAIQLRYQDEAWLNPSVQGKLLVARQLGGICSCIAGVTVVIDSDQFFPDVQMALSAPAFASKNGLDDDLWESHLAQCLSSELALLGIEFSRPRKIIEGNLADHLLSLVQALLDATTLERFPSCNLTRIRTYGAPQCYQSEKRSLLLLNSCLDQECDPSEVPALKMKKRKSEEHDTPGAAYNCRFVWDFSRCLGETLHLGQVSTEVGDIGKALQSADFDINADPFQFFNGISLESECLKRAQLLRTIVSTAVSNESTAGLNFRSISWLVIEASFSQLLRVSQGLSYLDRAIRSEGSDLENWKRPKLMELLTCFSELAMMMLTWILQENVKASQRMSNDALDFLCNSFLSPALSTEDSNICETLRNVVSLATGGSPTRLLSSIQSSRLQSTEHLRGCVRRAILRRGKQLIAYMASQYLSGTWPSVSNLFRAFLTSGISGPDNMAGFEADEMRALVCVSFESVGSRSSIAQRLSYHSPVEGAIDEYLDFVDSAKDDKRRELEAVRRLKYDKAIRDFLIPRIERANVDAVKKKPSVELFCQLLQSCVSLPIGCLQNSLVCSIVRCLWRCIRLSIELDIDDAILSAVFSGAQALMTLPVRAIEEVDVDCIHSIIQWSHSESKASANKEFDCLGLQQLQARYIWSFAACLKEIGQLIVDPKNDQLVELQRLCAGVHEMTELTSATSNLDSVSKSIINLLRHERTLFPDKENNRSITNVYARKLPKPASTSSNITLSENFPKCWKPTTTTRRKVKEFLSEAVTLT